MPAKHALPGAEVEERGVDASELLGFEAVAVWILLEDTGQVCHVPQGGFVEQRTGVAVRSVDRSVKANVFPELIRIHHSFH